MTSQARRKSGHRSDEITSYLSETLEPEERAAFEAHLQTCADCQDELEAQKALFARVNEALFIKPKHTIAEQVARFEKIVAAERATKRRKLRQRLMWQVPLGIAVAAALAVGVASALRQPAQRPDQIMAKPQPPQQPGQILAAPHRPPAPTPPAPDR
jgi:anti-sigma factor RsiW